MLPGYLEWLPGPLRQEGPLGLAWWQWIGCVVLLALAFVLGHLIAALGRWLLSRLVKRSVVTWDDELLDRTTRPGRWLCSMIVARLALPLLQLHATAHEVGKDILHAGIGLGFMRITIAAIGVGVDHLSRASWAATRPASRGLLRLGGRIATVTVVIIVLIATLAGFGLPVASLLAGLGIGGIALAFGAQKTVENLFGAFALGMDQPLREGDFVKVEDSVLGTVEAIGLRSTRIRTLDRTIVTLPNGRISEMRIETYAMRDRIRMHVKIGLVYATTATQLRTVLTGFEETLRDHPDVWKDEVVVRLEALGDSGMVIEVMAWLVTTDFGVFRTWRQEILLAFLDVIERAGTCLAYPTQTLHVQSSAPPPPPRPPRLSTPLPIPSGPQRTVAVDDD